MQSNRVHPGSSLFSQLLQCHHAILRLLIYYQICVCFFSSSFYVARFFPFFFFLILFIYEVTTRFVARSTKPIFKRYSVQFQIAFFSSVQRMEFFYLFISSVFSSDLFAFSSIGLEFVLLFCVYDDKVTSGLSTFDDVQYLLRFAIYLHLTLLLWVCLMFASFCLFCF